MLGSAKLRYYPTPRTSTLHFVYLPSREIVLKLRTYTRTKHWLVLAKAQVTE